MLEIVPIVGIIYLYINKNTKKNLYVGQSCQFKRRHKEHFKSKTTNSDKELQKIGVEVYAVSTDTHFTHKAWHDTSETIKKIKFPMIGDPTGAISRNFDVMIEEEGLALRGSFIINPDGIIKTAEINDLGIGRSAADLVRKVQAAQHIAANPNQACPASWKPGEEALTPSLDLVGKI